MGTTWALFCFLNFSDILIRTKVVQICLTGQVTRKVKIQWDKIALTSWDKNSYNFGNNYDGDKIQKAY